MNGIIIIIGCVYLLSNSKLLIRDESSHHNDYNSSFDNDNDDMEFDLMPDISLGSLFSIPPADNNNASSSSGGCDQLFIKKEKEKEQQSSSVATDNKGKKTTTTLFSQVMSSPHLANSVQRRVSK